MVQRPLCELMSEHHRHYPDASDDSLRCVNEMRLHPEHVAKTLYGLEFHGDMCLNTA